MTGGSAGGRPVLLAGSITHLKTDVGGALVVTGSHGAPFVAVYALRLGAGALVCHDAGMGLNDAGIAGLAILDAAGIPAAAVSHDSARIGDAADMQARGRISAANAAARAAGVAEGQDCAAAIARLAMAAPAGPRAVPPPADPDAVHRHSLGLVRTRLFQEPVEIVCLDSASDIDPSDAGKVVLTGSHGAVPAGETVSAVKAGVRLAAFNDAGVGIDGAGIARLAVLDGMGIPAFAVAAASARIGDGRSTWRTGIVSHANALALGLGIGQGQTVRALLQAEPEKGGHR